MPNLDFDPAHVRQCGTEVGRHGDDLTEAVGRLRAEVTGAGSPWGGDEFGTLFAAAYTSITDLALNKYGELATRLTGVGDDLRVVADEVEATDQGNAAGITGAGGVP